MCPQPAEGCDPPGADGTVLQIFLQSAGEADQDHSGDHPETEDHRQRLPAQTGEMAAGFCELFLII